MAVPQTLTADEVRAAFLHAQGFGTARGAGVPGPQSLASAVARIGLLQVDSVNVLVRAHYLPLFSRLGAYDRGLLDRLSGQHPRQLFEYWGHEASLIPVQAQPLLRWRMADGHAWSGPRRVAREQPQLVADVLATVDERGPITSAELEGALAGEHRRSRDHSWGWNWSDAKRALEYLFGCGEITTAGRDRTFTRRYDLTQRVIPAAVLQEATPSREDGIAALVDVAAAALAVATEADLRDYWRLPAQPARSAIDRLTDEGALVPVAVPGWPVAYRHATAVIPPRAQGRGLIAPFDPLVWYRPRTERVFGMRYRIEIYVPALRREFGYYVLPYLHDGRLVARTDLKADRGAGVLRVRGAWSQRTVAGDVHPAAETFSADLRQDLQSMAQWLGLGEVSAAGAVGDLAAMLEP